MNKLLKRWLEKPPSSISFPNLDLLPIIIILFNHLKGENKKINVLLCLFELIWKKLLNINS